jgi:CRP-like cAMP-binding protein
MGPPFAVPDGAVVFRKGDPLQSVYLVVSGAVLVLASGINEDGLVAVRAAGGLLAAIPATRGRRVHAATAVALGTCQLRHVPVIDFLALRERDLTASLCIGELLAAAAIEQFEWLVAVSGADLHARLLHVLVVLFRSGSVDRPDGSVRLRFSITRTLLARCVSAERESVVRLLAKLEREGLVVRENGWLVVPATSPVRASIRNREA